MHEQELLCLVVGQSISVSFASLRLPPTVHVLQSLCFISINRLRNRKKIQDKVSVRCPPTPRTHTQSGSIAASSPILHNKHQGLNSKTASIPPVRPAAIDYFILVERERQKEERIQHQKEDERYWKNKHQKNEKQKEAKQTGRQRERDRE